MILVEVPVPIVTIAIASTIFFVFPGFVVEFTILFILIAPISNFGMTDD